MWWFYKGRENGRLNFLLSAHFKEHHGGKLFSNTFNPLATDFLMQYRYSSEVYNLRWPPGLKILRISRPSLYTSSLEMMLNSFLYFPSKLGGKKLNKNGKPKQKPLVPLQPQVLNLSFWNAVSTALHSQAHYFYWPRLLGWCWQVNLQ